MRAHGSVAGHLHTSAATRQALGQHGTGTPLQWCLSRRKHLHLVAELCWLYKLQLNGESAARPKEDLHKRTPAHISLPTHSRTSSMGVEAAHACGHPARRQALQQRRHTLCTFTSTCMPISNSPARLIQASSSTYAGINLRITRY